LNFGDVAESPVFFKESLMADSKVPKFYVSFRDRFPETAGCLEELGKAARAGGPLDNKTAHLIQLAAAAAIQSEGSVHSHTRRAIEAGAKHEEIYHAVMLLVSTIGFPRVAAAISWVDDVVQK
jgi:AhpD family alkylhydroperoxidase